MNPEQQRNHRTVTKTLEKRLADVEQVTARMMSNGDALYHGHEANAGRLNACEDRLLMNDEESTQRRDQHLALQQDFVRFRDLSFWQRLRWFLGL